MEDLIMAKVTAEDNLLMAGFQTTTDSDSNGYDSSWDDSDVLKALQANPDLTVGQISPKINIPVHRVVAAIARLKTAGKFPVNPPAGIVVEFPTCSKGIIETVEPVTNILLEEPPRLIEPDGQLSLFFDDSEEPPDPDDFKSLDEYHKQREIWAKSHPELDQAMAERIKRIEESKLVLGESYQFQKGDRVQKISNPKWIGEIKSFEKTGAKIKTPLNYEYIADLAEYRLFSKANSDDVLGESFFNVGDKVITMSPGFDNRVFTVKRIASTGMVIVTFPDRAPGQINNDLSYSFPSMHLSHYVEVIKPTVKNEPEITTRKRPAKGCGSGYLKVREANVKRNAAKGKDPDVYYVYYYSYSNQYGKEIKSSISVPRAKIAQVKKMVEDKEHYVKIAKFLGKSLPLSY